MRPVLLLPRNLYTLSLFLFCSDMLFGDTLIKNTLLSIVLSTHWTFSVWQQLIHHFGHLLLFITSDIYYFSLFFLLETVIQIVGLLERFSDFFKKKVNHALNFFLFFLIFWEISVIFQPFLPGSFSFQTYSLSFSGLLNVHFYSFL